MTTSRNPNISDLQVGDVVDVTYRAKIVAIGKTQAGEVWFEGKRIDTVPAHEIVTLISRPDTEEVRLAKLIRDSLDRPLLSLSWDEALPTDREAYLSAARAVIADREAS